MIKIKANNTILYCKKWREVVTFYQTKLGLEVNTSNQWFLEFKLSEHSYLSIADDSKTSIKSSNGQGVTITFEVVNIQDCHVFLIETGCNPSLIKDHAWGAKVIHVYDPEGNRLEFWCDK